MSQKRTPQPLQQRKVRIVNTTPFRHRMIMAACGVGIALAIIFFLNETGAFFPSDITFRNVQRGEAPYVYLREAP